MFIFGSTYTRDQIASGLGISDPNEAKQAVLTKAGKAVAIAVNAAGHHPSQPSFYNKLTATTFEMEGLHDQRGSMIECEDKLLLFFQHEPGGDYRFEGEIEYVDTVDLAGRPLRRYKRI